MGMIQLEKYWMEQPQLITAVANEFLPGAKSIALPCGQNTPRVLVGPEWTAFNSPIASVGPLGIALQATGTNQYWGTLIPDAEFTTDLSFLVVMQKTDTTNRWSSILGGGAIGGASAMLNAHAPGGDGITYFDFGGNDGVRRISAASLSFAKPTALLFSAGPRGLEIWQDGSIRASNTTAASRINGAGSIRVNEGASAGDLIKVYMAAIWARQFSLQQNSELTTNPWQIFISNNAPIPDLYRNLPKRNI